MGLYNILEQIYPAPAPLTALSKCTELQHTYLILILHILLGAVLCPAWLALVHHIMAGLNKPVFPPALVSGPPNNVTKFSLIRL